MKQIINLRPINEKIVPAAEFPEAYKQLKNQIARTEIIPPTLGNTNDFGSIRIVLKDPVYTADRL